MEIKIIYKPLSRFKFRRAELLQLVTRVGAIVWWNMALVYQVGLLAATIWPAHSKLRDGPWGLGGRLGSPGH